MIESLLTEHWLGLLAQFRRLIVAFSGGLDSTVLLHSLLIEPLLHKKLIAVHINHGLSPNADKWQSHCRNFTKEHGVSFVARRVQVDLTANVEEHARIERYRAFGQIIQKDDCLLLGHHANDQAETLLLQLFRGAGIDGLSAMVSFKAFHSGMMARPFLNYPREKLHQYAIEHQLDWIDDESNLSLAYSRNYLRHCIFPLLRNKWPGVDANLVRAAKHCQEAKENLADLAILDCSELARANNCLPLLPLRNLPRRRLNNVLRTWLKLNQVQMPTTMSLNRIVDEVIAAKVDASPAVAWEGTVIKRYQGCLYILSEMPGTHLPELAWKNFPEPLSLGEGRVLQVFPAKQGLNIPENARLSVRYRQGGEHIFWRGQTKSLKKLLQQWQVPPWFRQTIPLLYVNNELAAVVGYAISDHFYGKHEAFEVKLTHNS
ncbi:tRNA lysidine(34) synthetase TilS [Legionella londiniensis]|uniref:tRNA lysidine(34) synthetase TilS n=1 Tax=Legionella londiniensis TaxID=45068 RepID=UPI000A86F713|nr:tRNA lysidine(34) synthetase TilS [Legionella londiniensis]